MEAESGRSLTVVVRKRGEDDQGPRKTETRSGMLLAELTQKWARGGICGESGFDLCLCPEYTKCGEGGVFQLEGGTLWGVYGETITALTKENEQLRALVNQLTIRN